MNNVAIKFENVSKTYKVGQFGARTLHEDISRFVAKLSGRPDPLQKINLEFDATPKKDVTAFQALQRTDLAIEQGDVVGIIGHNGAGKSTMLKLVSRITTPTTGVIKVHGRVASLLEVGTGFHPNLTGKENIYLSGLILGMKRREINEQIGQIIEFSECGPYIETPVKRYSSGMLVRLGFSVATHLKCETMIVDEVLAVSDKSFTHKAIEKMKNVSQTEGRTVLFVSHNLPMASALCKSGIVLDSGHATRFQSIEKAIENYSGLEDELIHARTFPQTHNKPSITSVCIDEDQAKIGNIAVNVQFSAPHAMEPFPGLIIHSENKEPQLGSNCLMHKPESRLSKTTEGSISCMFHGAPLHEGVYYLTVVLGDKEQNLDLKEFVLKFYFNPKQQIAIKPAFKYRGAINWAGQWANT